MHPHNSTQLKLPQGRPPSTVDQVRARLSVAHELGHYLIHKRESGPDKASLRLGSTREEEAIAEYAARLLLLPNGLSPSTGKMYPSQAAMCIAEAGLAKVTIHAATARLADPDQPRVGIRGAILWRLNAAVPHSAPIEHRLTPHWHLCPGAFVPIRRCRARAGSLVASLAAKGPNSAFDSREEEIKIGTLKGHYTVDAFAWGSVRAGTRLVLSMFVDQERPGSLENTAVAHQKKNEWSP